MLVVFPHFVAPTTEIVHVVLLGWEYDRAVLPFQRRASAPPIYRPHRVHLIVAGQDDARQYDTRVKRALEQDFDVHTHYVRRMTGGKSVEFDEVAHKVTELCRRELDAGNSVSVNVSSGSKLGCLAAGTACMSFPSGGVQPYYVVPEGYSRSEQEIREHGIAKGLKEVVELGLPKLDLPSPDALAVLGLIHDEVVDDWIQYGRLLDLLARRDARFKEILPKGTKGAKQAARNLATTTLTRRIIEPLKALGLIEPERSGREKRVRLTARGRLHVALRVPHK